MDVDTPPAGVQRTGNESTEAPPRAKSPESMKVEEPSDLIARAEKLKEEGNVAFREKRYGTAIDIYSQAIGRFERYCLSIFTIYLTFLFCFARSKTFRAYVPDESRRVLHGHETLQTCTVGLPTSSSTPVCKSST